RAVYAAAKRRSIFASCEAKDFRTTRCFYLVRTGPILALLPWLAKEKIKSRSNIRKFVRSRTILNEHLLKPSLIDILLRKLLRPSPYYRAKEVFAGCLELAGYN